MELESVTVIGRSIEDVFNGWSQIERFAEWWDPVIERRKLTDGPVGIGTKYHAVDKVPGRRLESTLEITAYEPHHLIAGRLTGAVNGTWEATFEETDSGTRMTLHTVANLTGVMGLFGWLLSGWAKRIDRKALDRFRASLAGGTN